LVTQGSLQLQSQVRRKFPTCIAARYVHALYNRRNPPPMKVKWKQIVARIIPAATIAAALFVTISSHADSVKWG
jgi:hypothetical protein